MFCTTVNNTKKLTVTVVGIKLKNVTIGGGPLSKRFSMYLRAQTPGSPNI